MKKTTQRKLTVWLDAASYDAIKAYASVTHQTLAQIWERHTLAEIRERVKAFERRVTQPGASR